jgi:PIN domain nuclease of toxin-antitoxin system
VALLLDTHALLWWLFDDQQLGEQARLAIQNQRNRVYVSAVSAWEIAIKCGLGKLQVPSPVSAWLPAALVVNRFSPLPIDVRHALGVEALPRHHADPFDRLLIAQALAEGLMIVTRDAQFTRYGVSLLSC